MGSSEYGIVWIILCALLTDLSVANSNDTYTFCYDDTNIELVKQQLVQLRQEMNNHLDQLGKQLNQQLQQLTSPKPIPSNCGEAVQRSTGHQSGVYQLQLPFSDMRPFSAYCLLDPKNNGSAWTVVQRRLDGSTDFNLGWNDYKRGFGNLEREYFIGLDRLHAMTQSQRHELWIELTDYEGVTQHAKYKSFTIGDELSQYVLSYESYEGDAFDGMAWSKDEKFSTRDNDNDQTRHNNCANIHTGGWWFYKCEFGYFPTNLNGQYEQVPEKNRIKGINWKRDPPYDNLKYVHMAIRPLKSN